MKLPGGLTIRGAAYYVAYRLVGTHLPYHPRFFRIVRTWLVHGFAPGVHRQALIKKRVRLGPRVTMGPGCVFRTGDHPIPPDGGYFGDRAPVHRPIEVEEDVFIGARAIILAGVTIGRGAAIGAGAVVAKDIPAGAVAVGNPARVVRLRVPPPPLGDDPYPGKYRSSATGRI